MTMPELFILKAMIAGMGIALLTGPLGCFIAWQRLAYFGDTIAHAALLGVVLAVSFDMDSSLGIIAVAVSITCAVYRLERQRKLASDTLLGIFSHGALALGLVVISLSTNITIDINGLLFGDILAVNNNDIAIIYAMAALVGSALIMSWKDLMRLTLHRDIAQIEGVRTERLRLFTLLAIAVTVAIAIKMVGILLITSLLIIPAASVRYFSRNPTQMAIFASLAGMLAVCGGLYGSLKWDTPSGASIILAALGIFVVSYVLSRVKSTITGT